MYKNRAQSIIEYTFLAMLVIVGTIVMGPYLIRSVNAHFKLWQESIDDSVNDRMTPAHGVTIPGRCECSGLQAGVCGAHLQRSGDSCSIQERYYYTSCNPPGCGFGGAGFQEECRPDPTCCTEFHLCSQSYSLGSCCGTIPLPSPNFSRPNSDPNGLPPAPGAPTTPPTGGNYSAYCYYGEEALINNCYPDQVRCLPIGAGSTSIDAGKCDAACTNLGANATPCGSHPGTALPPDTTLNLTQHTPYTLIAPITCPQSTNPNVSSELVEGQCCTTFSVPSTSVGVVSYAWTAPTTANPSANVYIWSGGGGGAAGTSSCPGNGGGGGGLVFIPGMQFTPGQVFNVNLYPGGAGGSGNGVDGGGVVFATPDLSVKIEVPGGKGAVTNCATVPAQGADTVTSCVGVRTINGQTTCPLFAGGDGSLAQSNPGGCGGGGAGGGGLAGTNNPAAPDSCSNAQNGEGQNLGGGNGGSFINDAAELGFTPGGGGAGGSDGKPGNRGGDSMVKICTPAPPSACPDYTVNPAAQRCIAQCNPGSVLTTSGCLTPIPHIIQVYVDDNTKVFASDASGTSRGQLLLDSNPPGQTCSRGHWNGEAPVLYFSLTPGINNYVLADVSNCGGMGYGISVKDLTTGNCLRQVRTNYPQQTCPQGDTGSGPNECVHTGCWIDLGYGTDGKSVLFSL